MNSEFESTELTGLMGVSSIPASYSGCTVLKTRYGARLLWREFSYFSFTFSKQILEYRLQLGQYSILSNSLIILSLDVLLSELLKMPWNETK
jgi:hypothetical protein